jgi:predicted AAA+ superfamily ATPase
MKHKFISIITEWQNIIATVTGLSRHYNEELYAAANSKPIKIITGFRRSGKSFLVQMVAKALMENKIVALNNVLYLNFEDYRLEEIKTIKNLDDIVQMFLHELSGSGKKLLIFDEIQNIPQWDKLIRTLYEKEREIEIFLTGSNSELLSSEIGSHLAGRFVSFEILPFTFKEFLAYQKIQVLNEREFYQQSIEIKKLFNQYVKFGGLPEIFTIHNERTKYSYLQGILSKVILDDIVQRFNVRQPLLIEKIIHYLHLMVGNMVTSTRITQLIKSEGLQTKTDTISTYIDYILKTFAMYELDRFDWKLKRVFNTNKKYFSVDTGLIHLFQSINNNHSKQLENIVFLQLKHADKKIYYGALENGKEIDFITEDRNHIFSKYQITQTLTDENKTRELSSFVFTDKYLNKMNNILLTLDENEESLEFNGAKIEKKYLLKWLLDIYC